MNEDDGYAILTRWLLDDHEFLKVEGQVIVTFLGPESVNLADRSMDEKQAADLRRRLGAFAEDWDRPEMDAYDAL